MIEPRLIEVGDAALRLEFPDRIDADVNRRVVALAGRLRASVPEGVYDVVPAFRSVTLYFDPLRTDGAQLHAAIRAALPSEATETSEPREPVRIAVKYGGAEGPDLAAVAARAGLSEDEVVRLHSSRVYRVFMMGFVPGFAYMGTVDSRIAAPRHATPRRRVAAGSVGIAGEQTGIYPAATPGGWQIIGRTAAPLVDYARSHPFLLEAGDRVRFESVAAIPAERRMPSQGGVWPGTGGPAVRVLKPGLLTTIQDRGRRGLQAWGMPVAGPMDPVSHRLANALVGNSDDAATFEVTLAGPELQFEDTRHVAVTGARFEIALDGREQPAGAAFRVDPGSRVRFGPRHAGARAYVAITGGLAVPPVFGSRATHLPTGIGGRALVAGDRIALGSESVGGHPLPVSRASLESLRHRFERPARLRVLPGPDVDRFSEDVRSALTSAPYVVEPDSDRMGYRLNGPALAVHGTPDIISDATPAGAVQVPASGQPMLLMADRQTSGGYPIVAVVISADLPVAGQLAPGDELRFAWCSPREALTALIAQERASMAIEEAR